MPDRELQYRLMTLSLVEMTRRRFAEINQDESLTPEDKKRLKEFYLEHFTAPRARKLLEKHFPDDFATS